MQQEGSEAKRYMRALQKNNTDIIGTKPSLGAYYHEPRSMHYMHTVPENNLGYFGGSFLSKPFLQRVDAVAGVAPPY